MKTIEYTFADKSNWRRGQWDSEPDKMQWQDEETGLPCLAVRAGHGAWCGYVGVAEGHPWFEQHYRELEDVEVHGGITFSDFCAPADRDESGICHVPDPGEPDHVWWLGFDCAHAFDVTPRHLSMMDIGHLLSSFTDGILGTEATLKGPRDEYRTIAYVRSEVASLARQVKAAQVKREAA